MIFDTIDDILIETVTEQTYLVLRIQILLEQDIQSVYDIPPFGIHLGGCTHSIRFVLLPSGFGSCHIGPYHVECLDFLRTDLPSIALSILDSIAFGL